MEFMYALFINLEPALEKQVSALKQHFVETYNWPLSNTKPHITVANNRLDEEVQADMVAEIEKNVHMLRPLKIELCNFDNFKQPNGSTIYIAVTDNKLNSFNLAANRALGRNKSETLHVTIARGLDEALLNKAWPKYAHTKFTGTFYAKEVTLTRNENGKYKTVQVFKFNPHVPDKSQQAALF